MYVGLIRVLWTARKYEAVAEVCRHGLREAQATNHLLFRRYLSRALVSRVRSMKRLPRQTGRSRSPTTTRAWTPA